MDNKKISEDFMDALILYTFRKPIIIFGTIFLILFIAGYYKFAVPVYEEHQEEKNVSSSEEEWVISKTTGEKVSSDEISRCLSTIGYYMEEDGLVLPENKEKIIESSDFITQTYGKSYELKKTVKDGKTYYKYYLAGIEIDNKHMIPALITVWTMDEKKVNSETSNNTIVDN